eukprot:s524_g17.t1
MEDADNGVLVQAPGTPVLPSVNNPGYTDLTLNDEDGIFLSKCCRVLTDDGQSVVLWCLKYCYDQFVHLGEHRKLNKWCKSLQDAVISSEWWPADDPGNDFRLRTDASGEDSMASTKAVLSYFFLYSKASATGGRNKELQTHLIKRIEKLCERAVSVDVTDYLDSTGADESFLEMTDPLTGSLSVSQSGRITGLLDNLSNLHSSSAHAWKTLWKSMHEHRVLLSELEDEVSLRDLTMFVLQADNFKRSQGTKAWPPQRITGQALTAMIRSLIVFLSNRLEVYLCVYRETHDTDQAAPARQFRRQDGKTRISMSVDAIWETLNADEIGVSGRDSLKLQKNPRLSKTGGSSENSIDFWVRKVAQMHDDQVNLHLVGAYHFNMVSDASTHAGGKNILLSLLWTHENETALIPNLQMTLPGKDIAPNEWNLDSLVEALAKERLTQDSKINYCDCDTDLEQ